MKLSVRAFNFKKTVIFSVLSTFIILVALIVGFLNFGTLINSFLETVNLREKSYVNFTYEEDTINLRFDIAPMDLEQASNLSKKLDIKDDWMSGISLTLDQRSVNLLKDTFPERVALNFEDDGIRFSSPSSPKLKSSFSGSDYQIATVSGSLTLNVQSSRDYNLKIVEPWAVLKYADAQGKIYLSTRAEGLLPSLQKIARIEIESRNGEVKGKISLR